MIIHNEYLPDEHSLTRCANWAADRLFRGGNAKGHNYPQAHGSGCPKEMSNSEIISDGFSEAKVVA